MGGQAYILGPCCLGADPAAAGCLLVRWHRMGAKKPVRIPRVALDHFCEVLLILSEALTGHPLSLDELFLRSFAGEAGEKLTDFILQAKVRAAKDRLIYTADSYEAIAMGLGPTSQSHFGQVFKRYTGMTPKRFQDLHGVEQPTKQDTD